MNAHSLRLLCGAIAAALLSGAPGAAWSQQPEEAPKTELEDPAKLQEELARIQQRLAAAEQKVMADPEIQTMQAKLQERVEKEVQRIDPEYEQKVARLTTLQKQLEDAQQAGDQAMVQQVVTEGQQIQQQLQAAQTTALAVEDVAKEVTSFQDKVHQKMVEVEPETDELVERAKVLMAKLQEAS